MAALLSIELAAPVVLVELLVAPMVLDGEV
jgi:hypothetical protein